MNLLRKLLFRRSFGLVVAGLVGLVFPARPTAAQTPDGVEFFEMRVRPVLAANCFACHTASKMGGLQVDSRESLLTGGGRGPALVPGAPDRSLLIQAVRHSLAELKMPPQGKLKPEEIDDLARWIKAGAAWPETIVSSSTAASSATKSGAKIITAEQRNFWAFRPIQKPELPVVGNEAWVRTPVDRFILARLDAEGLDPAQPAAKRTLIRRAYFNLIGLPPTPEQVDAFLGDTSPKAFPAVVEELLASPHYGERWGRHWLDVARYSDDRLHSTQMDAYPNSFRYRDWVIRAFNDDMPYDLFVKAQIAGDLIAIEAGDDAEKERLVGGLGFYGLSSLLQGQDDRVDATARGFLALTVGCARCHDHKFDPIPTEDYYALLGIFKNTELDEHPLAPAVVVEDYERQEEKVEEEEKAFEEFLRIQSAQLVDVLAAQTSAYAMAAWQVVGPLEGEVEKVARSESLDQETLERWVKYLGAAPRQHPLFDEWDAMLAREHTPKQVTAFARSMQKLVMEVIAEKKELDEKNKVRLGEDELERKLNEIELLSLERDRYFLWRDIASNQSFKMPAEFESGILHYGDRKIDRFLDGVWRDHVRAKRARLEALREMMPEKYPFFHVVSDVAKPENEHVHIRGNKGNLGDEVPRRFLSVLSEGEPKAFTKGSGRLELAEAIANPKNPLTARVMVNRIWLNHFGQALVGTPSNFGQMGERPSHPELLDYLAARFVELNWSIKALHREIMLSSTYALAPVAPAKNKAKNEEVDPENRLLWRANRRRLDVEAMRDSLLFVAGRLDPSVGGEAAHLVDDTNDRRTVYGYVSRRRLDTMLGLFDFPNPTVTSPQRILTSTPLQGLFFLNSDLVMEAADALAGRLRKEAGDDDRARILQAYRVVFGREPTGEEMRLGREFVEGEPDSWAQYAQTLLSSAEFLHVN